MYREFLPVKLIHAPAAAARFNHAAGFPGFCINDAGITVAAPATEAQLPWLVLMLLPAMAHQ